MKRLTFILPLMLLCLTPALAQEAWVPFPATLPTSLEHVQAVSAFECTGRLLPGSVVRLDARNGSVTTLLTLPSTVAAKMQWLSRDTGALVNPSFRTAKGWTVYSTIDAGNTWDSTDFVPTSAPEEVQLTSWGRVACLLRQGPTYAIGFLDLPSRAYREIGLGTRALVDLCFLDSLRVVGRQKDSILQSDDGGRSWSVAYQCSMGYGTQLLRARGDGTLFLTSGESLLPNFTRMSRDRGRSWETLPAGPWDTEHVFGAVSEDAFCASSPMFGDPASAIPWPGLMLLSYRGESGWSAIAAPADVPFPAPRDICMWSKEYGWYRHAARMYHTRSGGVPPKAISVSDYTTFRIARVRVIFDPGRHGAWASARLQRRVAGSLAWDRTVNLPFPSRVFWDDSMSAGIPYEYAVTVEYANQSSIGLLSDAVTTGPPRYLDLAPYIEPRRNTAYRYNIRTASSELPHADTVDVRWRLRSVSDTLRCTQFLIDETRMSVISGSSVAHPRFIRSRDAEPRYALFDSMIPSLHDFQRFLPMLEDSAAAPPDTVRLLWQRPGVSEIEYACTFVLGAGLAAASYTITPNGSIYYRHTTISLLEAITGVTSAFPPLTVEMQVFPHPVRNASSISLLLTEREHTRLDLYSLLGAHVATIHEGAMTAGAHVIPFLRGTLPAGEYVLQVRAGKASQIRLMILQ